MPTTRVGRWYATGPSDQSYDPASGAWSRYTVVSDMSDFPGHVTVQNAAGQQFPVPIELVDKISGPPE